MTKEGVIKLYKEMSDLTSPKCASACRVPHGCCSPEYCEMAIEWAKDKWGVDLQRTGHPRLPLMGPSGCTAAPHFRPLCTIHLCENQVYSSQEFYDKYFQVRDAINDGDPRLREDRLEGDNDL